MRSWLPIVLALGLATAGRAEEPAETPSAKELAATMRSLLLAALPEPLFQKNYDWGKQREVANGVTWKKDGVLLKPKKQEKFKNDGTWRRLRADAVKPETGLQLAVVNVQTPEKGKVTFNVVVTMPVRITFEQQVWRRGVRLYSGETRARLKPVLTLKCESTTRVEKTGSFLPNVYFRMRVLDAKLAYDDFVVEHTAGVGGEVAEWMGDAALDLVKQLRPSLEKDLLAKANKTIVKAGDTKEVKLGLGNLLDGK